MNTLYMLVGLPGAGKSTWVKEQGFDSIAACLVASSDDYIEKVGKQLGLTYNEAFKDHVKDAEKAVQSTVKLAVETNRDLVWDQTNLTAKVRRPRLAAFPGTYRKIAVVFTTPVYDEWNRRLKCRPGKIIPEHVIQSMLKNAEEPTLEEGFDQIIFV